MKSSTALNDPKAKLAELKVLFDEQVRASSVLSEKMAEMEKMLATEQFTASAAGAA